MTTQDYINAVEGIELKLTTIPMEAHKDMPEFKQELVVTGLVVALEQNYLKVNYKRVFKNKEGKVINITKECPDWIVSESTETTLLDTDFQPILVDGEAVKISTIKFLTYLQSNNIVGLVDLIEMYAPAFIADNIDKFNE